MMSVLESSVRPFPCVYGISGFRTDGLRFAFLDRIEPKSMGPVLKAYMTSSRSHGRLTSLVTFERPGEVETMQQYRTRFWQLLDGLSEIDESEWPHDIPTRIDHPRWEFCFAGEPIFVVCNSPAHIRRQSRRSSGFTVTFQPRWVFEGITDTEKNAMAAFQAIRSRISEFDMLEPSPALGRYGDASVREYAQYFLDDENNIPACPMNSLRSPTATRKDRFMGTENDG